MDSQKPIFHSLTIIEERIQEKLTVKSLAESLHFSRYHYQRLFREAVGESVMRYVNRRRITLAADEIAKSALSILEIALKYGYDSHEGFTRSFKSYMGVTPVEYRKYHCSIAVPKTEKERCAMLYSKTTDEIIRELNSLIVQAKETAVFTEKMKEREDVVLYRQFLDMLACRVQELSEKLSQTLEAITDIARCPDQIIARFMLMKAIEDAAFWSSIISFQARLTIARAKPEHRTLLEPLGEKYEVLSGNARMKAGKIADFFNELSALIFQDMRENAGEKLKNAIQKGELAGKRLLENPDLPYAYIGDEILEIVREISSVPLEKITVNFLEDCMFRVDIIVFAADVDVLREPSHQWLFEGISEFRERLKEAFSFFQGLAEDIFGGGKAPEEGRTLERTVEKSFSDLTFQGNILLFYLKGEIRKLRTYLDEGQQMAFDTICSKLGNALDLAHQAKGKEDAEKIAKVLKDVNEKVMEEAGKLGDFGAAVKIIAEEIGRMEKALG